MKDIRILFLQDGDRRWAQREGVSYAEGYLEMARKFAFMFEILKKRGISKLYFPANSLANLLRPKEQVDGFFEAYLRMPEFTKLKLKITLSGDFDRLPDEFKDAYKRLEAASDPDYDFEVVLILNWSLVDEVVRIANRLQAKGEAITEKSVLANSDIPEKIDFIIRCGYRRRLSAFIPLSGEFAELYFMDILFPDITADDINQALDYYEKTAAPTRTMGV